MDSENYINNMKNISLPLEKMARSHFKINPFHRLHGDSVFDSNYVQSWSFYFVTLYLLLSKVEFIINDEILEYSNRYKHLAHKQPISFEEKKEFFEAFKDFDTIYDKLKSFEQNS